MKNLPRMRVGEIVDDIPWSHPRLWIMVNGEPEEYVIEANAEEGWIDQYLTDTSGNLIPDNGTFKIVRIYGRVEIIAD